ncbi:hypothetical protein ENUP19_0209G0005 [Entamoeba nuttalli]|uniref:High mobility group (HMG) box domain containing protein n=2 Tax=Entamoeba nuttalli TaxID=412467 RepID=K2H184_ENTNP|nr:high mobility group (HMG) box domain containing protein [Entamoeba nuttalli P19]EKE40032.1 high mobility group (HMG) box domain containing protein [Entamoeba nuttalli P19]|eukprot:XP_008857634.1 high mobility group (HMG) box domain containing protein [Entamoeba nuttalli P19]
MDEQASRQLMNQIRMVEPDLGIINMPQITSYITQPPTPYHIHQEKGQTEIDQQQLQRALEFEKVPEPFIEKKERKKRKGDHKSDRREEMLKEIAQEIYIRWKVRKLLREQSYDVERAEKKAERRWRKETADVTRLFYKAAIMENTMLGDEESLGRKKKKEAKIKEDCHPYLLFCKEHREQLGTKYNGKEVLTILSEMWKKLDPVEKDKYNLLAKKNKMIQTTQQESQVQPPQLLFTPNLMEIKTNEMMPYQ